MAVLPVCLSPMISSRWPRPIGVMASMALIPVCSGSFTFWRCTTDGACSSRARSSVPSISPLPSSGTPSGSTTRPRNPSPTGTDSTSPVRRTCWPSSTLLKSPRMTTPISRMSRLSARPRIPPGNSSSSLAIAEGSPSTRAMPSPSSATVPTSCLEAPSGSYAWTKLASASRISSGRIVSSAMVPKSLFSLPPSRAVGPGGPPWLREAGPRHRDTATALGGLLRRGARCLRRDACRVRSLSPVPSSRAVDPGGLPWSCRRRAKRQRARPVLGTGTHVVPQARRPAPRPLAPSAAFGPLPAARCLLQARRLRPYTRSSSSSCREAPPERDEAAAQRPVNELVPDLDGYAAHHMGIDDDIQLNAMAVDG